MSDTYRRARAIDQRLLHRYPQAHAHQCRHLATLSLLLRGRIGSHHSYLPNIVEQTLVGVLPTSASPTTARCGRALTRS